MSDAHKPHSDRLYAIRAAWVDTYNAETDNEPLLKAAREDMRWLVEQFEVLRQAEEAARVQERVGNEGDADAIRRSAIAQVLKLGIYADLNPAKERQ